MGPKLVAFGTLGVIAVLAGPPALLAQSSVPPLPPIGLPLPQIGLPLPRIGLPPPSPQGGGVINPAPIHRPPMSRTPHSRRGYRQPAYIVPAYGWPLFYDASTTATAEYPGGPTTPSASLATTASPPPAPGGLILEVEPGGDQQIYVDGYYIGTPVELAGRLELEAGPHVLEVTAAGYESLRVPVNLPAGRSITYRGSLQPIIGKSNSEPPKPDAPAPGPGPAAPPAAPMTGYVIPGCYVGNVHPSEVTLPATCDASQVIRIN